LINIKFGVFAYFFWKIGKKAKVKHYSADK